MTLWAEPELTKQLFNRAEYGVDVAIIYKKVVEAVANKGFPNVDNYMAASMYYLEAVKKELRNAL